jgi:hypothetical protein
MPHPLAFRTALILTALLGATAGTAASHARRAGPDSTGYDALVALFEDWRAFQAPRVAGGVPDYTAAAMAAQHRALAGYRERLAAIDTSAWPVAQQVDYHLVRAEMNGLDFDHRVRQPWARDPAFYAMLFPSQTDIPAREGPVIHGAIELWAYPSPLSPAHAAALTARLEAIPPLLDQARDNLTGNARDLWRMGIRRMAQQRDDLAALASRAAPSDPAVAAAARRAEAATEAFRAWLERALPSKTGPSGVGVAQYDWYLRNVHLVPYTWQEEVAVVRRELARAHAALRLEEHRNRALPPLEPIDRADAYDRRLHDAVTEYLAFLRDEEVVSVRAYMEGALRARVGRFSPGPREFFSEVNYRDPLVMRTHHHHWFDLARMEQAPHPSPIRRVPLLYNIFDGRAEGLATGMEEMMMHAGLFDGRPRARELVYVMLAQRAARALGDLYMHSNDFTIDEAVAFAAAWTPRGWMAGDSETVWGEQHLYLQQPAYGTSYIIGKIEIELLLAERARQQGDAFTLKGFMDALEDAGLIPVALIRWELTGLADEIDRLRAPR